jgi:hypothetical protein
MMIICLAIIFSCYSGICVGNQIICQSAARSCQRRHPEVEISPAKMPAGDAARMAMNNVRRFMQ